MRRWAGRLALLALSLAVAAVVGEGLVRALAPQPLRPAWNDELGGVRVPRSGLRGRHRHPGAFDVTVSINAQRFRARRDYAAEPPPGTLRVAVLGDSMAFGWGAEDAGTYPAQLERLLSAKGRAVEVINAGFPGTCLGEKVAWYEMGVRPFRPRLVVLTLLGDDVDGDLYWRVFRLEGEEAVRSREPERQARPARSARSALAAVPGSRVLAERSQLFAVALRGLTRLLGRERTTALGQRPANPEEVRRFHEEGLPLLRAELRWLHGQASADGARLAVVFVPFRQGIYGDAGWWADELRWKSRAIVDEAGRVAAALGVPFDDLTPALAARPGRLYHDGAETHPTPEGYRAIAEEVAALLERAGLLSDAAAR